SVPFPVQAEPGVSHAMDVASNFGILPRLAAVERYFHLLDCAAAGPRQSADLVNTGAGQLLSARRRSDDGFRTPLQIESCSLRIRRDVAVIVVGHVVLV